MRQHPATVELGQRRHALPVGHGLAQDRLERARRIDELGKACRVGEQLPDRRRPVPGPRRNQAVGTQVAARGCVEVDQPLLGQLQHRDRGERLGDGPDPEYRVLGHRRARGDAGEPVPVEEAEMPVADHAHCQADGGVAARDRGKLLIQVPGHRLCGRRFHRVSPSGATGTRAWAAPGLSIVRGETPIP